MSALRLYALCMYVCFRSYFQTVCLCGRNNVISSVTRLRAVRSRQGQGICFFSETPPPLTGVVVRPVPIRWVPDRFSPRAKTAGA
jgi:hypothetical protein